MRFRLARHSGAIVTVPTEHIFVDPPVPLTANGGPLAAQPEHP